MPTIDDLERIMTNIEHYVQDLPNQLLIRAGQIVIVNGLSDISETLGTITAGEFRTGNQVDPGRGFSGMRMAYPGMTYSGQTWNLVGVNNDVLQVGIRASDGKLVAGAGTVVLDSTGITVTDGTDSIIISSSDIHSANYAPELSGFIIRGSGDAEFNNIIARGEIRTSVLTYQEVQAYAGTLGVFKSAGVLLNSATVPASGSYTLDIRDPAYAHAATFATNDVLRIKNGLQDTWMTVQSVTDNITYFTYTVLKNSGTAGVTYTDGQAVIDYGPAGQGILMMTADSAGAPYFSVRTHAGSPWSAQTELARLGNLNGYMGYASNLYGLAIGEYAANKPNLTLDPTNGLRIRMYATTVMQFTGGNADITGKLRLPGTGSALAIGTTPPTAANAGTGIWLDRTGLYSLASNVEQIKIDAITGKLLAGGGNVKIDADGFGILMGNQLGNGINWYNGNFSSPLVVRLRGGLNGYLFDEGWLTIDATGAFSNTSGVVHLSAIYGTDINSSNSTSLTVRHNGVSIVSSGGTACLAIDEGLYVGNYAGGNPGKGNIRYTGDLQSYKNSTAYTGYIYHPLFAPVFLIQGPGIQVTTTFYLPDYGIPVGCKAIYISIGGNWNQPANNSYYLWAVPYGGGDNQVYVSNMIQNINHFSNGLCMVNQDRVTIGISGWGMNVTYVKILGYFL